MSRPIFKNSGRTSEILFNQYGKDQDFTSPFDQTQFRGWPSELNFANRWGLTRYAQNANNLALALSDPAEQLREVNKHLGTISEKLNVNYSNYVGTLRKLYLPEEEVFARADAYIKPLLVNELELLKMQYPYAVGNAAGGQFNPLEGIAEGRGRAGQNYDARRQFSNWRSLKKAFKKSKKHRRAKKARKSV